MHEASLVQGLMRLALEAVEKHGAAHPEDHVDRIEEIVCEAGLLACFEANALGACFEILAEGTLAEGAKLTVNTAPLACSCGECGARFTLLEKKFVCPECGSRELRFKGGNGLTLQAINVHRRWE